jgi:hypothetical protein
MTERNPLLASTNADDEPAMKLRRSIFMAGNFNTGREHTSELKKT